MKITAFNPLILSNNADEAIKLFEDLGFKRRHTKEEVEGRDDTVGVRMKHENGFYVDIVSAPNTKQDSMTIRMNVRDFDEAKALLEEHGFTPSVQGEATDKSMRSIGMFSPTGFPINITEHLKDHD